MNFKKIFDREFVLIGDELYLDYMIYMYKYIRAGKECTVTEHSGSCSLCVRLYLLTLSLCEWECVLYYSSLRHCGAGHPQWISSTVINVLRNKRESERLRKRGYKQVSDRTGWWQRHKEYSSRHTQSARTLYPQRQILRISEQFSTAFSITSNVLRPRKELPIKHRIGAFNTKQSHPLFSVP